MKRYRTAVIGAGFIGMAHIEALRRLGNVEVVALCDVSGCAEKADAVGIPAAFTDYREMIETVRPDAIHICVPNFLHYQVAGLRFPMASMCCVKSPLP